MVEYRVEKEWSDSFDRKMRLLIALSILVDKYLVFQKETKGLLGESVWKEVLSYPFDHPTTSYLLATSAISHD
jgi:hypothetical protein